MSSVSKVSISRAVREQAAAVAGEQHKRERGDPGEGRVDVNVLEQRTAADRLGQARQIEAQPDPNRTRNALACTQCSARSVRLKRGEPPRATSRRGHSSCPTQASWS